MSATLDDLLEDRDEVDLSVAAGVLQRVLRIDRSSGEVRTLKEFDGLSGNGKVCALALGYRAAVALGKREGNGFKAGELETWSGMPRGTVAREIATLAGERLLVKKGRGIYDLPAHAVQKFCDRIKDDLDGYRP